MLRELVHNQTQMHSMLKGLKFQHCVCVCTRARTDMYTCICNLC